MRAIGAEYVSAGVDPTHSRERFYEAARPHPPRLDGGGPVRVRRRPFYRYHYVNPWPRPLQQPHPPDLVPGSTSLDTIDECAKRRIAYMLTPISHWLAKKAFRMYYDVAEEKYGYTPDARQLGRLVHTHVAETDEQAHREARPHVLWFFRNGLKMPRHFLFPAGYNAASSLLRTLDRASSRRARSRSGR